MPSQVPPPGPTPAPMQSAGRTGLIAQFTGNAAYGILIGLASVVIPLVLNRVYFFLPLAGLIVAIYALVKRQVIGGVIGVILNVIGGIFVILSFTSG